jgi:S1-C subfamily serine protease
LRGLSMSARGATTLGDVITAIDGTPVRNYDELYNALDTHQAGDRVKVQVTRGQEKLDLTIPLVVINNGD